MEVTMLSLSSICIFLSFIYSASFNNCQVDYCTLGDLFIKRANQFLVVFYSFCLRQASVFIIYHFGLVGVTYSH